MRLPKLPDKNDPLEKQIEAYFRGLFKGIGGIAYKFSSPGNISVPDRLCLLAGMDAFFIEFKRRGKKPTARQWIEIGRIRAQGYKVYIIDTKEKCRRLTSYCQTAVEYGYLDHERIVAEAEEEATQLFIDNVPWLQKELEAREKKLDVREKEVKAFDLNRIERKAKSKANRKKFKKDRAIKTAYTTEELGL